MADPINLVDPKSGEIFEAADEDMATRQMQAFGLQRAQPQQIQSYDIQQRSTGFVDKAKEVGETLGGMAAHLASQASPYAGSDFQGDVAYDDPSYSAPDAKAVSAHDLAPFAFTPQAKERREANPDTAIATTIAADVATGFLIPGAGVAGALASSTASGLLTEAGTSTILDDEYSMKDAAIAAGAGLAFEGAGLLAFKGAMYAKGKVSNYLDIAVERARKAAASGAEVETDAARAAAGLQRNAEELYTKHQATLDEALGAIDERTAGAPDRMFTPGALKKTVSQNYAAQEEAFLDVAVKFDQAAQVAEVPGLGEVAKTMQDALGKNGANMFDAMRSARRQLDEIGKFDNPLVKEATEALDASLRHEPTWGRAAKNYADVAEDASSAATDAGSINLREPNARELLDQRLDRARRMASLTNDQKLKNHIKAAEDALEGADRVTGARVMAETSPADIKALQKKLDGFAERAPKLGKELHGSYGKLNKLLDGSLGELSEDAALDYVAARASGVGAKTDPLRDVFVKAEQKIADMKAKGANPTQVARATAAMKDLREAVGEIHDIPRAAQRVRDWQARPQATGLLGRAARKVGTFGDDLATEEIQNAIQPMFHGAGMTIGLHAGGVPGAVVGYLGGRAINKAFGERIAKWAWKRSKQGAVEFAKKNPLEAAGALIGGGVGMYAGPKAAVAGAVAGRNAARKVASGAQSISRRVWKQTQKAVAEEGEARAARSVGAAAAGPKRGAVGEVLNEAAIRADEALESIAKGAGEVANDAKTAASGAWEYAKGAANKVGADVAETAGKVDVAAVALQAAAKARHAAGDAVSAVVDAAQKAGQKAPDVAAVAHQAATRIREVASDVSRAATSAAKAAGAQAADVARAATEAAAKVSGTVAERAAKATWDAARHVAGAATTAAKHVASVAQRAALKSTATARSVASATAAAARRATAAAGDVARAAGRALKGAPDAARAAEAKVAAHAAQTRKELEVWYTERAARRAADKELAARTFRPEVQTKLPDYRATAARVKENLSYVDEHVLNRLLTEDEKGVSFLKRLNARLNAHVNLFGWRPHLDEGTKLISDTLDGVVKRARREGNVVHGTFYHATEMSVLEVASLQAQLALSKAAPLTGVLPPSIRTKNFIRGSADFGGVYDEVEALDRRLVGQRFKQTMKLPVVMKIGSRGAVPINDLEAILTTPGSRLLVTSVKLPKDESSRYFEITVQDISLTAQRRVAEVDKDRFAGAGIKRAKNATVAVDEAEKVPLSGRLLDAAKENPEKIAGAALFGASLAADDNDQTLGASAASAGLLLLLLPRNMGRRAAFEAFEHRAAQAGRAVSGSELPAVRRALEAARSYNRNALRTLAQSTGEATPDQLLSLQMQQVRVEFAQAAHPGTSLAPGYAPGVMSDEAKHYVQAELSRSNAGWVNGDGGMRRAYDEASRELELSERAARGENPSPRAQLRDRTSDMRPEAAARLREDAIIAVRRLGDEDRQSMRAVFAEALGDITELSRRFAHGEPLASGEVLQSAADLLREQSAALTSHWRRLGYDVPAHPDAVQMAGLTELHRINAETAFTARAAQTRPEMAERVRTLQAFDRDANLEAPRAARRLSRDQSSQVNDALNAARADTHALVGQYVRGALPTRRALLEAQTDIVRREAGRLNVALDTDSLEYVRHVLTSEHLNQARAVLRPDAMIDALETENVRSLADQARQRAAERWGSAPEVHTRTAAREIDPDRLARAGERVTELGGDGAPEYYASQTRAAWGQLPTSLQRPVREGLAAERGTLVDMARRYVNGSPTPADAPLIRSAAQLFDEQVAHLRRRFAEDGRHIGPHYGPAVEAAVEAEVRRLNAQVADMTRTEHLALNPKPTPGAEEFSTAPNSPEARASFQRPRPVRDLPEAAGEAAAPSGPGTGITHEPLDMTPDSTARLEAFDPGGNWHALNSAADDARVALHREQWRSLEYRALDDAFDHASRELTAMLESHADDGVYRSPGGRAEVDTPSLLVANQRSAVIRRLGETNPELLRETSPTVLGQAIEARLGLLNAREAERLRAARGPSSEMLGQMRAQLDEMIARNVEDISRAPGGARAGSPVSMYQVENAMNAHLPSRQREQVFELMYEHRQDFQRRADDAWREANDARIARYESTLKPSDQTDPPAVIDGLPTEAAFRLDKELLDPLERMGHGFDSRGPGHDSVYLDEMLPEVEEAARKFARDNPNIADEEAILGYARRRHAELTAEMRANDGAAGPVWHALEDEGGFARWHALGEPDDDALRERLDELVREHAYDAGGDENASLNLDDVVRRAERLHSTNSREARRIRELADEHTEQFERDFDEIVSEDHRQQEEDDWANDPENPDNAPDSDADPDSEPASSRPDEYRNQNVRFQRGNDDGLPPNDELKAIGLTRLEVNANHGVEAVFGRDLTADEIKGLFSLEHLHEYAKESGETAVSRLEVGRNSVEFSGEAGSFEIESTFRAGDNGLDIHYGLMRMPPEWQGTGAAKRVIGDMIKPVEGLGGGKADVGAAWLGKYAWLRLGLQPEDYAAEAALKAYKEDLGALLGAAHPGVEMSMARIKNTRDLADAYLPKTIIADEKLAELRQAWEERRVAWQSQRIELQPFKEGAFRTSRSGNEQFLAGKYFLVMRDGPWNGGLTLNIKPGDPWYEEFKVRLGLGAGGVGLVLGLHELNAAFTGTDMHVSGIGGKSAEDDTPPEVTSALAAHAERFEKVERTREKLGYLKTESETISRDTARAIANPNARQRIVASIPGVTGSQGIARFLGSNATLQEAYDAKRQTFQQLERDPMVLVNELAEGLSEVQQHAPDLHAKMVQQSYKVVQYLQGKLPSTIGASLTRPDGSPPNALAVRQFALYFSAATDPSSVMGDLSNNRARKEQVDTLRDVWPDVYQDLKVKVVQQLAEGRPTVAQRTRLDLLFDLGENLDRGLSPRLVGALAQYRAQQGGKGGKGAQNGGHVPSRRTQPSVGGTGALGALALGPAAGPGTLA